MAPNIITTLLCSDTWVWDNDQRCVVRFNEDGTGELLCGVEFTMLIACQIDWELRSKAEDVATELPAEIDIAITLTKRELKDDPYGIPHTILSDAAYQQKIYHLRLEKGGFEVKDRTTYGYTPVYRYQLLWDKSPYPPLEEWNYKEPAEGGEYWERKDFYKGDMEKGE